MKNQSGAALFVALIILVILMIIGVTSVRNSSFQERMAANTHITNWSFAAAEAGLAATYAMANATDPKTDLTNIINQAFYNDISFCVDSSGSQANCGAVYLDSANQIQTEVTVSKHPYCQPQVCYGNSLGPDASTACVSYEVNSTSTDVVSGSTETVTLVLMAQLASCN